MTDSERSQLKDFAQMLRSAPRQGEIYDIPEGAKYITISNTLARDMAILLEKILA